MFIRFLEKGPYYNIKIWALYVKATPNSHTPFFRQCSCTRYISTTSFIYMKLGQNLSSGQEKIMSNVQKNILYLKGVWS